MAWYYRFEAKGIQRYVLGGRKLWELVGASALIEHITKKKLDKVAGAFDGEICYRAAGGATLRFESESDMQGFAACWPMEVAGLAPGLTVAQTWRQAEAGDQTLLEALAKGIAAARSFTPPVAPSVTPVIHRAPDGGLASAHPHKGQFLSETARIKREASEVLADDLYARFGGGERAFPKDVDAISDRGRSYVAVVHADGNAVGQLVQKMKTIEEMATFAEALTEATEAAVRRACETTLFETFDEERLDVLPGRPIVVGGDDVTAIVRADLALEFVQVFCDAFAEETTRLGLNEGRGLTASAGVAFIRAHHPFRDGYRLAEDLCGRAKKAGRAHENLPMVAFYRNSASLAPTMAELDRANPQSMGPYALTDTHGSLTTLRAIRELGWALAGAPRGPVREFARVLQEEPDHARGHLARMAEVQAKYWEQAIKPRLEEIDRRLLTEPALEQVSGKDRSPWYDAHTVAVVEGRRRYKKGEEAKS